MNPSRRSLALVATIAIALAAVVLLLLPIGRFGADDAGPAGKARAHSGASKTASTTLRTSEPGVATGSGDAASELAAELNAPEGNIRRDLEIASGVFAAWQSNFPREGNPVGENHEITAALTGANSLGFAFIPRGHRAINRAGELCDRWGTPFRFHQVSGTHMEICSAGPDRKLGTADDVQWPE